MADDVTTSPPDLTSLTVQLLSAYVANNKVEHGDLAGLIQSTKAALSGAEASTAAEPEAEPAYKRAVTVKKSLADPDRIVSMIDGKSYRTLTRHLKARGLTPAEYRERYRLPPDYPTIAPGYSEQRRQVARTLGLGRKAPLEADAGNGEATSSSAANEPPAAVTPPATRARTPTGRASRGRAAGAKAAQATPTATPAETAAAPATEAAPKRRGRRPAEPASATPPGDDAAPPEASARRRRRAPRGTGGDPA